MRLLIGAIYLVLAVGSITMIYPLLLMLGASTKSASDFHDGSPLPAYLWDDQKLWAKYIESKYNTLANIQVVYRTDVSAWSKVRPPALQDAAQVSAFTEFRRVVKWPNVWRSLGHFNGRELTAKNGREFRKVAKAAAGGDLTKFSDWSGVRFASWAQVVVPQTPFHSRRFNPPETRDFQILYDFTEKADLSDWIITDLDALYVANNLKPGWPTIKAYNEAHDTAYESWQDVQLSVRAPEHPLQLKDWETFVRNELSVTFLRIDPAALGAWREFLAKRYFGVIQPMRERWGTAIESFESAELPAPTAASFGQRVDLSYFVRDPLCDLKWLTVEGPRQAFERWAAQHAPAALPLRAIPVESIDYQDFSSQKASLRWEFFTRNFRSVLDYILLHGNALWNTVLYCTLAVGTNLLVNPLAAYALSRYRPPSTYTILLFCMCTMAFPAEVTMIPSFLLLKRFPLYPLVIGAAAAIAVAYAIHRAKPDWPIVLKGAFSVSAGALAGWWLLPLAAAAFGGAGRESVSLLNTFWALVLPGMANGFSIFLLKGFFDSLPRELYESADIDGASEWHKFWMITMTLSKPILAVIALGAFTAAYGEFLMALVTIPDPKMWTIMVWLFQMQSWSHPSVVYASLVVAAVPTFLIFLFAQNLIMRGIVVPTEK